MMTYLQEKTQENILEELKKINKKLEKLIDQGNPDGGMYVVEYKEDGTTGSPFPDYLYKTY